MDNGQSTELDLNICYNSILQKAISRRSGKVNYIVFKSVYNLKSIQLKKTQTIWQANESIIVVPGERNIFVHFSPT